MEEEVLNLMTSMIKFTDKVMKMKKNGYKGYTYKVEQVDASGVSIAQAANEEEKIPVLLQFDIDHLDWESIKKEESEETFLKYSRGLGLYIMLTNKESEMTQIFKVDLEKSMKDTDLGKISHQVSLSVPTEGNHKFEYTICDNYGFLYTQPLLIDSKK